MSWDKKTYSARSYVFAVIKCVRVLIRGALHIYTLYIPVYSRRLMGVIWLMIASFVVVASFSRD